MQWASQFIGRPYAELGRGPDAYDCWGLVRAALKAAAGIEVPSYAENYLPESERAELAALIAGHKGAWLEIVSGEEKPLDLALFRMGRWASHVGVVTKPGRMLHVSLSGQFACIEDYRRPPWPTRLVGFYRHTELAGSCTTLRIGPSLVA